MRTNDIESNIEEDIDLKNQYRIENLPDPISIREAASKNNVDNLFNDSSIVKNTEHIDLNERNITNARFIQVNQLPLIDSHLTAKLYVDNAIGQSSLLRLDPDETLDLDNEVSIILNSILTEPKTIIETPTRAYIDSLHEENERSRRDLGIDFYDESSDLVKNNQSNDFNDNIILNVRSIQINDDPSNDNHVSNKKYIDDELDKKTILRFNQTLQNYLKVSVGNYTYNLTKYNKIQLTDTAVMKSGNTGGYLLPYWKIICNDKNNKGKIQNFIKSTKSNSPTGSSGATTLPPIGTAIMFIETIPNNSGSNNVFYSWERTVIIQKTNITFYYNRFSTSDNNLRAMRRFRIQLLLEDNTWSDHNTIAKNTKYTDNSTDWTLLNLDFTVENYGIELIYDQIDTAHADMCFSKITITHSVY